MIFYLSPEIAIALPFMMGACCCLFMAARLFLKSLLLVEPEKKVARRLKIKIILWAFAFVGLHTCGMYASSMLHNMKNELRKMNHIERIEIKGD